MSLLFNMLSRLIIAFLPRSKGLLISWLQSPSAVILEPPKIKSLTVSIVSPSSCHEVMGPDAVILVFRMLSFKPLFHSPLSLSSRGSLNPLLFLPLKWCYLNIWGWWYSTRKCWFQPVKLFCNPHFFHLCVLNISVATKKQDNPGLPVASKLSIVFMQNNSFSFPVSVVESGVVRSPALSLNSRSLLLELQSHHLILPGLTPPQSHYLLRTSHPPHSLLPFLPSSQSHGGSSPTSLEIPQTHYIFPLHQIEKGHGNPL